MSIQRVICGDNVDILHTLPDSYVDLTVTSPPYDNLRDYKGYSFDFESVAKELYRVTEDGGVVVWVVGDSMFEGTESGTSFRQALYFKEVGFNLHDTMIYKKDSIAFPNPKRYHQCFEYMFVFSKGPPKTANLIHDRKNATGEDERTELGRRERQKDGSIRFRAKDVYEIKAVGARWNIWEYGVGWMKTTADEEAYKHPAMFPEKLAADHIISWSNEGDLVLDPFNGSGTTTKMAKHLGRQFIGIDISEEYCEIARKRLSQDLLF